MNWSEINLAHDLICPSKKRHQIYWGMILYLGGAGILLAVAAGTASMKIRKGVEFHQRSALIQKIFKLNHPNEPTLYESAEQLKDALGKKEAEASSINTALPPKAHTMLPLLSSLIQQTNNNRLYALTFSQQTEKAGSQLEFSIYVPVTQNKAPEFSYNWQEDEYLSHQFNGIIPVTTRHGRVAGGPVSIRSYKAVFKE